MSATAATPYSVGTERFSLPLDLIVESKTNPRKNFDAVKLQELAVLGVDRGAIAKRIAGEASAKKRTKKPAAKKKGGRK